MGENFTAELKAISKRLKPGTGGRGRRSTLFRWLYERADGFQRVLADSSPSWDSVAEALTAHGLTDGTGKTPTAERVRKTWFEVRRAKGWHLIPQSHPPPAPPPVPSARLPAFAAPPQSEFEPSHGEDDDFELRTINPRKS